MTTTYRNPRWHWPQFAQTLCGQMTDRERLGLPDHYLDGCMDSALTQAYAEFRAASTDVLLDVLASPASTLAARIACGNVLAPAGDPRICVEWPEMVEISGGEVHIGLNSDDVSAVLERFHGLGLDRAWIEKECPRHRVTLAPYRLARYPVTNAEYRVFLLDTGHAELPSSWHFRRFPQERGNHPVYTISPESADAYARWLSQCTRRAFRLPAEAEWEWAAAGPEQREFPWGAHFDAGLANTAETGLFTTSPVGAFVGGESPFGLSDMAGNIEEYVAGVYAPYPGGLFVADHLAQMQGAYRVARGGSFARFRDLARTRRRHGHNPKSATYAMGFRLAESP
jgi:formylglycine-generating enzyme required for sulfatase activity